MPDQDIDRINLDILEQNLHDDIATRSMITMPTATVQTALKIINVLQSIMKVCDDRNAMIPPTEIHRMTKLDLQAFDKILDILDRAQIDLE